MQNNLQEQIVHHINNPSELEQLYRKNKSGYADAFSSVYHTINHLPLAQFWNERLNYKKDETISFSKADLIFVLISIFIAGWIVKLPFLFDWNQEEYMTRNIGFFVFEMIFFFFAWKEKLAFKKIYLPIFIFILSAVFINMLPKNSTSNTLLLSCIHLPIFLWSIVGYASTGNDFKNPAKRIGFLKFNGDLIVMGAVMAIASFLFTIITMGLFKLIGLKIEDFYANYVVIWGLPAIPILATVLVKQNPHLVGRVSPIIARIFTPLVFITLFIFLIAIITTGKDPYNDREFLIVFNLMLLGVMAIILFSLGEISKSSKNKWPLLLLFALSLLTIINDGVALTAIVYRISVYGASPNRMAVLGSNVLIISNLILVSYQLYRVLNSRSNIDDVEKTIARFIPLYSAWAAIVTFLFPFLFNMK